MSTITIQSFQWRHYHPSVYSRGPRGLKPCTKFSGSMNANHLTPGPLHSQLARFATCPQDFPCFTVAVLNEVGCVAPLFSVTVGAPEGWAWLRSRCENHKVDETWCHSKATASWGGGRGEQQPSVVKAVGHLPPPCGTEPLGLSRAPGPAGRWNACWWVFLNQSQSFSLPGPSGTQLSSPWTEPAGRPCWPPGEAHASIYDVLGKL